MYRGEVVRQTRQLCRTNGNAFLHFNRTCDIPPVFWLQWTLVFHDSRFRIHLQVSRVLLRRQQSVHSSLREHLDVLLTFFLQTFFVSPHNSLDIAIYPRRFPANMLGISTITSLLCLVTWLGSSNAATDKSAEMKSIPVTKTVYLLETLHN